MAYNIVFDVTDFERSLGELINSFEKRAPLMKKLAGLMEDAVQENFEVEGRQNGSTGKVMPTGRSAGAVKYSSAPGDWRRASRLTATMIWRRSGPMWSTPHSPVRWED